MPRHKIPLCLSHWPTSNVWWTTHCNGLVRIRSAATSRTSCMKGQTSTKYSSLMARKSGVNQKTATAIGTSTGGGQLIASRPLDGLLGTTRRLQATKDIDCSVCARHLLVAVICIAKRSGSKNMGDRCMNRNERRIACIRLMFGPDPARSMAFGRLLKQHDGGSTCS